MAEGRGGGRESAMQRVQIPRRRGHEVTYTACFCRQATVFGVFVSPASPQYGVFIFIWRANPKYKVRAGETHPAVAG
jgi:hypothetical protein